MANTYSYFTRTAGSDYDNAADFNQLNKNIAAVISTNGTASPTEALDQKFSVTDVLNTASTATDKVFSCNYIETHIGPNFNSGIIKSGTSVINDTTFSSISNWAGTAGAWYATVTLDREKTYEYTNNFVFYSTVTSSNYRQITPMTVDVTSTTEIVIGMPINNNLFIGAL